MSRRFYPHGSLTQKGDAVVLTPEIAGWARCGLQVIKLLPGETRTIDTGNNELFVLPISATDLTVTVADESFAVDGRTSVFSRVTDFVYVGRDSTFAVTSSAGGEIALPSSRCDRHLPARYGPAEEVNVETRGAASSTRQVTNFGSPEAWAHADKLMCVELLTPDGNWSSYPPHKHDDSPECTVNNEELYYFRIGRVGTTDFARSGFGIHRTYTGDREEIDDNIAVGDGDVYLIPRGFHGPCIAAPGYPMYYLNVLGCPDDGPRSMAFCDDPDHHWVRDSWDGASTDPRCPMTSADGVACE